jgi:FtsZ-interacting cell division protein YlmF
LDNVHTDTVYFFVGVFVMADENEVKQVQEPAQEQQQQQSTEQKPPEPPPPEQQVSESQAPEAADTPSENPNP